MDNAYTDIEEHELKLLRDYYRSHGGQEEGVALAQHYRRNYAPAVAARFLSIRELKHNVAKAFDEARSKKPKCEHKMEAMFSSHNDSYRGQRCTKCGYTEFA